ncbi:MAG: archaellin/type IV pilin N-terminal domain-containing protein [Candidatus Aenigmatarchaeota archaeon]
MKGVSAIIATILLLLITISLAGVAYMYMVGIIGGKTQKTISVFEPSCTVNAGGTRTIGFVISNDGTVAINTSSTRNEIKVYINNQPISPNFQGTISLTPQNTTFVTISSATAITSGANRLLVISPSNSVSHVVYCPA